MGERTMDIEVTIADFLAGRSDPEQDRQLSEWLAADPSNRERFEALRDAWLVSCTLADDIPDVELELEKFHQNINSAVGIDRPTLADAAPAPARRAGIPSVGRRLLRYGAVAAVSLAAGALAAVWLTTGKEFLPLAGVNETKATGTVAFTAERGSSASVVLPDSSTAVLNSGSSLTYNPYVYGDGERAVDLSGEAYFTVESDRKVPFVVRAKQLKVTATGTVFNVKAYPDENTLTATLESGTINITGSEGSGLNVPLLPGQTVVCITDETGGTVTGGMVRADNDPDKVEYKLEEIPVEVVTSWKDDRWIVDNETLGSLAVKLERRYNVEISFADPEAASYSFTGSFERETIEEVLAVLRLTTPIRYTVDKGYIEVRVDEVRRPIFDAARSR